MPGISKQATLLFLVRDHEILLAMKKRGFGAGRWNGVGGKPEPNESIEQTAIRECQEEIGVTPEEYVQVASLDFYFPYEKVAWNQKVTVYMCTKWQGEPVETDEMKPQWYDLDTIPYTDMWKDDIYWLPAVIAGDYVDASFRFDEADEVLEHHVVTRP